MKVHKGSTKAVIAYTLGIPRLEYGYVDDTEIEWSDEPYREGEKPDEKIVPPYVRPVKGHTKVKGFERKLLKDFRLAEYRKPFPEFVDYFDTEIDNIYCAGMYKEGALTIPQSVIEEVAAAWGDKKIPEEMSQEAQEEFKKVITQDNENAKDRGKER